MSLINKPFLILKTKPMKNVLLFILATFVTYTINAQCSASFTYTTSGLTVYLTNTSSPSPGTVSSTVYANSYINYGTINLGFGTTSSHTYSAAGTYVIKVINEVRDSPTNVLICMAMDSQLVTVTSPPCNISISKTQNANFFT